MDTDSDFFKNPMVLVCFFASACFVLAFITRRIVEAARPDIKKQADENEMKITYTTAFARWWNTVILYALAPTWGVALALGLRSTEYLPESFRSPQPAVIFGLVSGFLCGMFFKIFKKLLAKKVGFEEADLTTTQSGPPVP
jgi:hypothetical protein